MTQKVDDGYGEKNVEFILRRGCRSENEGCCSWFSVGDERKKLLNSFSVGYVSDLA